MIGIPQAGSTPLPLQGPASAEGADDVLGATTIGWFFDLIGKLMQRCNTWHKNEFKMLLRGSRVNEVNMAL